MTMTNLKIIAFCAAMSAALTGCAQTPPAPAAEGIVAAYPDFTKAAESTINGVVSIKSYATPRASRAAESDYSGIDPFFDFFFGTPQRRQQPRQQQQQPREQQLGLGSGVILTSDGYIATNNHVIQGAERLQVTLNDNSTYDATVVGSDEATDLALLKIEAKDLPVIPMGDSDNLKVGEWVIAVGNPFGLTSTVTAGIVSAKARGIGSSGSRGAMTIDSYIQTDAAVNAGNSGGALVNTKGELVGINAAIYSQTGNYAGYSFAIPSSIVTKIVGDLREYGTVQRAVLGIRFGELTPELAKEKGITGVNDGIYVGEVIERSAAFEAGLKEGDIIVAADNTPVHTSAQFQEHMARLRPGDVVKLAYLRDGKQHIASATLRNPAGTTATTQRGDFTELGCTFAPVSDEDLNRLGLKAAIRVSALTDGKFRQAGVPKDFIILEVNGVRISSVESLEKLYDTIMSGSDDNKVLFITGLYPTGKKAFFAIDLTN